MVSPADFDKVRAFLNPALEEAFRDFAIPPVELAPGYWELWPARMVRMGIEEPKYYIYGVPYASTGNLRIMFRWPYQEEKIRLKKIDENVAARIAHRAAEISRGLAQHYGYGPEKEKAFIEGLKAVQEASDEDLRTLWVARGPIWTEDRPNWDVYHEAVRIFLTRGERSRRGVLEWLPDSETRKTRVDENVDLSRDSIYDAAARGVAEALDDWAVTAGLLDNAKRTRI